MGRHSSGSAWPYYLSFALWALPWVVIACLVGFAVWVAVDTVGGDQVTVQGSPRPTARPEPSETPSPTPVPEPTPSPEEDAPEDRDRRERNNGNGSGLAAEGVTVQVINGTGGIQGAAAAMADRLARLGYTVEAFTTGLTVDQSVVYYSDQEDSRAAVKLAGYLGFVAGPAPPDLSREIDLHVVVSAADA